MSYEESLKNCLDAHDRAEKAGLHKPQKRGLTVRDPAWWLGLSGSKTSSGISVTPNSAMRTSVVWACIRVLAYSLGALPLHVIKEFSDGRKEKVIGERIYNILHRSPNPRQTAFTFRKDSMTNLCLYGNAYAEIEFDNFGNIVALWPVPPWCCEPMLSPPPARELFYRVTLPDSGTTRDLQAYRMIHVMGLGTDGLKGLSPIRQMAETLGISLAAEQFGAAFFGNGMNVGGVAEHPNKLSNEGSDHLRKSLNEKYAGLGNAHRLLLLEEGMKYQKVGIPPEEAQFLETRQFQVEDIARIYGVQLHKIGHLLHATFSNIEHQGIEFVTDTMLPWTVNWEMEYDRKLLSPGMYTKHSLEGLLRGDSASRAAFYRELFYLSSISPDEIREKEDWNPIPDGSGKRYYVQGNLVPSDKIDAYITKNTGTPPARALNDAVKRISERDKQNILRAYQKDPAKFTEWLDDYYRDFPDYMIKEIINGN